MLTQLSQFFNKNIAPIAHLDQIEDDNSSTQAVKCYLCGQKTTFPQAEMVNGYIKLKCDNH
jgi:hypothetical protein